MLDVRQVALDVCLASDQDRRLAGLRSILIFPNSHSGTLVARSMFFVVIAWVGEWRRWSPVEW